MSAWDDSVDSGHVTISLGPQSSRGANSGLQIISKEVGNFSTEVRKFSSFVNQIGNSPRDTQDARKQQIRVLKNIIKQAHRIAELIAAEGTNKDRRVIKVQNDFDKLKRQLKTSSDMFRKKTRQFKPVAPSVTGISSSSMNGVSNNASRTNLQPQQQNVQVQFTDLSQTDVEIQKEKQEELKAVGRDLVMLKEMTSDLNELLEQEGQALQEVEANVDDTIDMVEGGTKHILSAIENRSDRRKYMCYFALVLVIVLIAICVPVIVNGLNQGASKK
eukprot:g2653.t1